MNNDTFLQDTADRIAVTDVLYQFAAGIDQCDQGLLASVFTDDAVSDFTKAAAKAGFEYPAIQGRADIVAALSGSLGGIDTSHSVSNPRVTLNGETARLEALVEAQHLPRSDHSRHYLMKNRYEVDLVKQEGAWLIRRMSIDNIWLTGDPAVLAAV